MNYTINEIPDEAVELSGNEMIPIWQGETKKVSVATLASSGIPVGAVMPFANGTTSENWLLCDGRDTTGTAEELQTKYPALYTYLGNSNILPAQFDHSKLSDYESITWTNSASGAFEMQYDGIFCTGNGSEEGANFMISSDGGISWTRVVGCGGGGEPGTWQASGAQILLQKGWKVYVVLNNLSAEGGLPTQGSVAYYKQPLYIKAT